MINNGESDAENSDVEEPSHELDTDNSEGDTPLQRSEHRDQSDTSKNESELGPSQEGPRTESGPRHTRTRVMIPKTDSTLNIKQKLVSFDLVEKMQALAIAKGTELARQMREREIMQNCHLFTETRQCTRQEK